MEKKITKLSQEELLEVSGGRENYVKRSWAKKFDTVGMKSTDDKKEVKITDDGDVGDERGE